MNTSTPQPHTDLHDRPVQEKPVVWIKGARLNNLKNVEVVIPKNKLIVVTGLSGSGKSSLIMDTLYAEGQRRYVESLSSYARQFLNRMKKPEVDFIRGICPAIAIEQKTSGRNARSTVGSMTEIYDLLRLLFARAGQTISPVSGDAVRKQDVTDVVTYISELEDDRKIVISAPIDHIYHNRKKRQVLEILLQKGFTRFLIEGSIHQIQESLESQDPSLDQPLMNGKTDFRILVDRLISKKNDQENLKRAADSIQTAFTLGEGICTLRIDNEEEVTFSRRFELDGIQFVEPSPQLFNFNNPFGACPRCEGYGRIIGIDNRKVIPDARLSVYEGAVACWSGEKSEKWLQQLVATADQFEFPIHRPVKDLSPDQYELLWNGNSYFRGINQYFDELLEKTYKIQVPRPHNLSRM